MSAKSDDEKKRYEAFQTPKGVHDVLPDDHSYHTYIKKVVRHRARQAGFRRITTPMFEYAELFSRSLGNDSDVVSKEMYLFEDKKGRKLALKPEGTAGVVRSYIENGMNQLAQPVMLYYIEPNFRYDRPQQGRYRQFWQFGFEIIGESDPALDAQLIFLVTKIHEDLGLGDMFRLQVNTIGSPEARRKYVEVLEDFYVGKERAVPAEFRDLIHKNPLRLLDKSDKDEDLQILAKMAPVMKDYLDKDSLAYHEELLSYLDELGIEYEENPSLVRGLDYYNKTVFEFWDKNKGAQNAVGGGGRYDGLVELLGGQPRPAVGYAGGLDRILVNMKRAKIRVPMKDDLHVFVAQLGKEAKKKCIGLIGQLHKVGVKAMGAVGKGSINEQLGIANKFKVPYTILMGITEVKDEMAIIRDMTKGTQVRVPLVDVVERMVELIGEDNLDRYTPGELTME
ncbi:histidine--tRNA ligase [Candidatus Peregrinibacteria bacterium HGW-Peregrinibacteria-1]|jgi:histidyl-tRNA synthetase|nr:MAG: histidine--tRNA ligase [Candidatus Peregrinibacteria bacterium HGW-Peregrinibacteria-1]